MAEPETPSPIASHSPPGLTEADAASPRKFVTRTGLLQLDDILNHVRNLLSEVTPHSTSGELNAKE
jgi:hypothetical protein